MARNNSGSKRNAQSIESARPAGRGADRSGNDKKNTNVTNRPDDERVTPRAARGSDISGQAEKQRKGGGSIPGVSGRPMNRRKSEDDIDRDDVAKRPNRGASSGTNKSARILQKSRKGKRAA